MNSGTEWVRDVGAVGSVLLKKGNSERARRRAFAVMNGDAAVRSVSSGSSTFTIISPGTSPLIADLVYGRDGKDSPV
jgi:hypothetical protein